MSERHSHHSDHDHSHERPITKAWQHAAALGSLAIGAVEAATSKLANIAGAVDGAHNVFDAVTYWMQSETLTNDDLSPERKRRMKKLSYAALSLPSLGFGIHAASEFFRGGSSEVAHHSVAATAASVALNGLLYSRLHRNRDNLDLQNSGLLKHLYTDTASSVMALGGSIAEANGFDRTESVAATGAGLFTAWVFRPTEKNLAEPHVCALHTGDHNHEHNE